MRGWEEIVAESDFGVRCVLNAGSRYNEENAMEKLIGHVETGSNPRFPAWDSSEVCE